MSHRDAFELVQWWLVLEDENEGFVVKLSFISNLFLLKPKSTLSSIVQIPMYGCYLLLCFV